MGEQNSGYVKFSFDNKIDTKNARRGIPPMIEDAREGYIQAVAELAQASRKGDLDKIAEVKQRVTQYASNLEALGQAMADANKYDEQHPDEKDGKEEDAAAKKREQWLKDSQDAEKSPSILRSGAASPNSGRIPLKEPGLQVDGVHTGS